MRQKRSFIKQLMYSTVLIALPVCVVLLLNYQITGIVQKLCMDNYIFYLDEVGGKMDGHVRDLDNRAVDIILNTDIGRMLDAASPKVSGDGIYPLYKFGQTMRNSFYSGDDFYREYQILSRRNSLVYRNNAYICGFEFFFQKAVNYSGMTYGQWHDSIFETHERTFLPAQPVAIDGAARDVITYLFPVVYGLPAPGDSAVIAFLIESKTVADILSSADIENSANIFMFSGGSLIFSTKNADATLREEELELLQAAATSGARSGFFETSGGSDLIAYSVSPYNGAVYAAVIPKSVVLSQMYAVTETTHIVLMVYLVISVALAVMFAHKSSKPLRDLVANLISSIPESKPAALREMGEISFITENILRLLQRNTTLAISEKDKSAALADLVLDRLLSGHAKPSDTGLYLLEDMRFPKAWERCCVCALKIPAAAGGSGDFPIFDLAKTVADTPAGAEGMTRYVHVTNDTVIAVIFAFVSASSEENRRHMTACLAEIDAAVFAAAGVRPYMGIGRFYSDIYDIHFSYDQAIHAAETLSGGDPAPPPPYILRYNDMARSSEMYFYPVDLEYHLANCVRSGDVRETMSIYEKIIDENFNLRSLRPRIARQLCSDLYSTLLKICDELGLGSRGPNAYVADIEKFADPEAAAKVILDAFIKISSENHSRKRSHNDVLKEKIIEFISENYDDQQICVSMVAGRFNLSESYFSQFFKMQTGEFFSGYLEKLRIDKAKKLIETDGTIEIEALSQMVGYNSANTFRRAFKRVVGVSPSSYRRI